MFPSHLQVHLLGSSLKKKREQNSILKQTLLNWIRHDGSLQTLDTMKYDLKKTLLFVLAPAMALRQQSQHEHKG